MPYHDVDPDDPQVLVGVELPADRAAMRELAVTLAEEFAQLGLDRARVLELFHTPFYAGAHRALLALGETEIAGIVDESLRVWGRCRVVCVDAEPEPGRLVGRGGVLKVLR